MDYYNHKKELQQKVAKKRASRTSKATPCKGTTANVEAAAVTSAAVGSPSSYSLANIIALDVASASGPTGSAPRDTCAG